MKAFLVGVAAAIAAISSVAWAASANAEPGVCIPQHAPTTPLPAGPDGAYLFNVHCWRDNYPGDFPGAEHSDDQLLATGHRYCEAARAGRQVHSSPDVDDPFIWSMATQYLCQDQLGR
jgi:hypothetical protein